jgi:hypothetical protein
VLKRLNILRDGRRQIRTLSGKILDEAFLNAALRLFGA